MPSLAVADESTISTLESHTDGAICITLANSNPDLESKDVPNPAAMRDLEATTKGAIRIRCNCFLLN